MRKRVYALGGKPFAILDRDAQLNGQNVIDIFDFRLKGEDISVTNWDGKDFTFYLVVKVHTIASGLSDYDVKVFPARSDAYVHFNHLFKTFTDHGCYIEGKSDWFIADMDSDPDEKIHVYLVEREWGA